MRENAFRALLAASKYTAKAQASRLSRARRVECVLAADLDDLDLSDNGLIALRKRLQDAGAQGPVLHTLLNAVRVYRTIGDGDEPSSSAPSGAARAVPPMSVEPRSNPVISATIPELMRLYADVLEELRFRGVTRTANGPVGDYAEWLFARAFRLILSSNSAAHHDAIDVEGKRYQIKGRRVGNTPGSRQLGALRRLPEAGFDSLAAVLFDRNLGVLRAALIPYRTVCERAKRVEHTNSWRFLLSDEVWRLPEVEDATEPVRIAAEQV